MTGDYRVGPGSRPISKELRELLAQVETATIGHIEILGFVGAAVQPVFPARACGTALTVAAPGRDGAIICQAIDALRDGDILVISRVDRDDVACVGDGVATAAKARGAAAIVLDGPCTDCAGIMQVGLPVWCSGVSSKTTNRKIRVGGALSLPVACGAAAVLPGYAVLADETGVFVADAARMQEIAIRAIARQEQSKRLRVHLAAGQSIFDFSASEADR
jgi:4-hydroxy-4-methyl-2-oxoglutarate aldolase